MKADSDYYYSVKTFFSAFYAIFLNIGLCFVASALLEKYCKINKCIKFEHSFGSRKPNTFKECSFFTLHLFFVFVYYNFVFFLFCTTVISQKKKKE